ncbi:MAG: hypothetical protein OK439_00620 [Thaumarchaeota archaeon]|nr:hypothetical protein [Nitrososphaerota archaeon]
MSEESTPSSLELQAKVRDIHSALSNSDSLRIFNLAAEGIDASTSVLEKHQFTKKRYYGRLKELVDLGLVFKKEGEYKHTVLGSMIFENQVKSLEQILVKKSNLEVISALKKNAENGALSMTGAELPQELMNDLEASTGVSDLQAARFFATWNELSSFVALKIETMKTELFAATRYIDFRTADTALRAAKRGCKVNLLHSNRNGLSTKLQLMGNLMAHPKALSVFKELTNNPNIILGEATVPYSFLVIDNSVVGIEIVNPEDPYSFFFGLEFENPDLAQKLISHFREISKSAETDSIAAIIESNQASLQKTPQRRDELVTSS